MNKIILNGILCFVLIFIIFLIGYNEGQKIEQEFFQKIEDEFRQELLDKNYLITGLESVIHEVEYYYEKKFNTKLKFNR